MPKDEFTLSQGHIYGTIPMLYKQWSVSFDLNPHGTISGWSSVFRMGQGARYSGRGNSMPSIWFWPNTNRLHICVERNNSTHFFYNPNFTFSRNRWTTVKITHLRKNADSEMCEYQIKIGDWVACTFDCGPDLREYKDINVSGVKKL